MTWPALFVHQFRSLIQGRRMLGLGLLAIVPGLILLVVGLAGEGGGSQVFAISAGVGSTTFPIAALILAAATLRDERDQGTLPFIYLKPIPRSLLATSSLAAAGAATSLIAVGASVAVTLAAWATGLDTGAALATLPLFVAAAVGYSAAFVPLGYLVPRVILVGLAYVVVWEQIAARLITGVANTSIWRFALSIYADITTAGGRILEETLGPVTPGSWGGVAKIMVVVLAGGLVLTWALRSRDAV